MFSQQETLRWPPPRFVGDATQRRFSLCQACGDFMMHPEAVRMLDLENYTWKLKFRELVMHKRPLPAMAPGLVLTEELDRGNPWLQLWPPPPKPPRAPRRREAGRRGRGAIGRGRRGRAARGGGRAPGLPVGGGEVLAGPGVAAAIAPCAGPHALAIADWVEDVASSDSDHSRDEDAPGSMRDDSEQSDTDSSSDGDPRDSVV